MIGFGRGIDVVLEEGAVLCVQAWVSEEGTGGYFERELLRVGPSGPNVLSRSER
jgi:Xaa-Pro dipeptidase